MTLGERIKKVRKALDLTQQLFAEKIGTSANVLTNYETGRRNPSKPVINNICKTFDVSEKWLRTGEGEMLLAKPTAALDALAVEHSLSNSDYIAIEKFLSLKPETRKAITDYMREVSATITTMEAEGSLPDDPAFLSSLSHGVPRTMEEVDEQTDSFRRGLIMDVQHQQRQDGTEPDVAARLAELERQNQELTAKLKAMEEEDALLEPMDSSEVSPLESVGTFSSRVKK